MNIKDSKILNNIPEYLINENENASNAKELIEYLNPNAVNITASLIDKIYSELDGFNDWSEYDKYISEFKLDEVFDGLKENLYDVANPELLKGFFTFKGTSTDIKYLMKIAGYHMTMYESDYYRQALSMYDLIFFRYDELYSEILELNTKEEVDSYFDSIDLQNPDIDSIFSTLKFPNPNDTQYYKMYSLINTHLEALGTNFDKVDCTLTSEVYVDLDSPTFDGVRVKELHHQIREIIKSRISACIFLRELIVYLETKTFFPTKQKIHIFRELDHTREMEDNFRMFCYLIRIPNVKGLVVNNVEPIKINELICPEKISNPHELNITKEMCDIGTFNIHGVMYDRKLINLDPIQVEGKSKEDCRNNKIQGILPTYFAIGYFRDISGKSIGKINNLEPMKLEGRSKLPLENYEIRLNDNYPTSVGEDKYYNLNNAYPMKVKGYFNFEILDSTEDLLYEIESKEDIYKPSVNEEIELERSTEDSIQMFDGVLVDNYTPIRVENISPMSVKGTEIYKIENPYKINYTRETLDDRDYIETSYLYYRKQVNNITPFKVNDNIIIQGTRDNVYDMTIDWNTSTEISYFADNAYPIEINNMMPTKVSSEKHNHVNSLTLFEYTNETVSMTYDPIDYTEQEFSRETLETFTNKLAVDNQTILRVGSVGSVHGTYAGIPIEYAYDIQDNIEVTKEITSSQTSNIQVYDIKPVNNITPNKADGEYLVVGTIGDDTFDLGNLAYFMNKCNFVKVDNNLVRKIKGNNSINEVSDSTLFIERTTIIIDYTRLKVGKDCVYDNLRNVEIGAVIQNDATVKLQGFV